METLTTRTFLPSSYAAIPWQGVGVLVAAVLLCMAVSFCIENFAWLRRLFETYRATLVAKKEGAAEKAEDEPDGEEPTDEPECDSTEDELEPEDEPAHMKEEPEPTDEPAHMKEEPEPTDEPAHMKEESEPSAPTFTFLRSYIGTLLWLVPFFALLIASAIGLEQRFVMVPSETYRTATNVIVISGLAVLARVFLVPRIASASWRLSLTRDAALMLCAAILTALATEIAWNQEALTMPVQSYVFSAVFLVALMVPLYFFAQRSGVGPALVVVGAVVLGIADYFVVNFREQPILPSDVLSLGTAAAVADGYTYEITTCIYTAAMLACIALAVLSYVTPTYSWHKKPLAINLGINCVCGFVFVTVVSSLLATVKVEDLLDFTLNQWWPASTYEEQGFVPSFTAALQDMPIDVPEGYSDKEAEEIQTTLAAEYDAGYGASEQRSAATTQFDETKPCVVAIMNEAFSDPTIYSYLTNLGYTGPEFYESLSDTLQRGSLRVSICGGGTATTEFEFFTNNSLAYIGSVQPYQIYNLSKVDSLAKQFSNLGYDTTAMHPNLASNYHRDSAYRQMGFDEYLSIDDFEGEPTYHNGVTDASTYNKILEILRTEDDPQFIFDLTMQNHGGYGLGSVPDEDLTSYYPEGVDSELSDQLNVYLAGLNACDNDLRDFIGALRELDRPVVVVFFGDHQPSITTSINNVLNPDASETECAQLYGQTTYFIWANYDVAGNDQVSYNETLSSNELSAQMLNLIGAPLSDYQKALLATRSDVSAVSLYGVLNSDTTFWLLDDKTNPTYETLNEIACMQYLNFARKVS